MRLQAPFMISAICGVIVACTAAISIVAAWFFGGLEMSVHGWIAYGLGCLFTASLAAGLFYLLFKSARDGHDDIGHHEL